MNAPPATTTTTEPRRANMAEIAAAKSWIASHWDADDSEAPTEPWEDEETRDAYAEALEIIIHANGGRYGEPLHGVALVPGPRGTYRHRCGGCGWRSALYDWITHPEPEPKACPNDRTVIALTAFQFYRWAPAGDAALPVDGANLALVHLVRTTWRGTPGDLLCGNDRDYSRYGTNAGYSVGGQTFRRDTTHKPCEGCLTEARRTYPCLPVRGSSADAVRAAAAALNVKHLYV